MQQTDPRHDEPAAAPQEPAGVTVPESVLPPPGERRTIVFNRRVATITHDRVEVRPSRGALVPPLIGFILGALCILGIVYGIEGGPVPTLVMALLLLLALFLVPFAGISLVYALFGANVVFDRAKQSGTWQQGFLGMGVGTAELVPFWKIDHIAVAEAGDPEGSPGGRVEELSQWETVLVKKSGKRLTIASMTVPRAFVRGGLGPVRELAEAVAALTGAPLRLPEAALASPGAGNSRRSTVAGRARRRVYRRRDPHS